MPYLLDSNVLIRLLNPADPQHPVVLRAARLLRGRGEHLSFTSQNLVEFWSVCTRPASARGGYGLTVAQTDRKARWVERLFTLVPESPAVHVEWRHLVVAHSVSGVQVHDARLVAAMLSHGITHVLTLNHADFARYPGVTAVHPRDVR
jgi:predicted nucleic acid-binding protein